MLIVDPVAHDGDEVGAATAVEGMDNGIKTESNAAVARSRIHQVRFAVFTTDPLDAL